LKWSARRAGHHRCLYFQQIPEARLQVIVLDHADEEVWGDLPNIILAEEWRDRALVPFDWLNKD